MILNTIVLLAVCEYATAAHEPQIKFEDEESSVSFHNGSTAFDLEFQRDNLSPLNCNFAPDLIVGNRTRELECCYNVANLYNFQWSTISMSLTTFLETLRQWNCPQFEEQCRSRVFAFTPFSELVYDYFCNYTNVVETCLPQVVLAVSVVEQRSNSDLTNNNITLTFANTSKIEESSEIMIWKSLVFRIQPSLLTIDELKKPCIGIAQYDAEMVHDGGYQELINFLVPSCELTWCGFSAETFRDHKISFWTCLISR